MPDVPDWPVAPDVPDVPDWADAPDWFEDPLWLLFVLPLVPVLWAIISPAHIGINASVEIRFTVRTSPLQKGFFSRLDRCKHDANRK